MYLTSESFSSKSITLSLILLGISIGVGVLSVKAGLFIVALLIISLFIYVTTSKLSLSILPLIFFIAISPEVLKLWELSKLLSMKGKIRFNDVFIAFLFLCILFKISLKEDKTFYKTSLFYPILIYMMIGAFSTGRYILQHSALKPVAALSYPSEYIPYSPLPSILYFLKYSEFYIVYLFAANIISSQRMLKRALVLFVFVGVIVGGHAVYYSNIVFPHTWFRAGMPLYRNEWYDAPGPLAGYSLIMLSLLLAFILNIRPLIWKIASLVPFSLLFAALIYSGTRSAFIAIIPAFVTIGLALALTKKNFKIVVIVLIIAILLGVVAYEIMPRGVFLRVKRIVRLRSSGLIFDASLEARFYIWRQMWKQFLKRPIFGNGYASVYTTDNSYLRILMESGIAGFLVFIFMLSLLFRNSLLLLRRSEDNLSKSLGLGGLGILVGIIIFGITTDGFQSPRIMENFWLIAGLSAAALRISLPQDKRQFISADNSFLMRLVMRILATIYRGGVDIFRGLIGGLPSRLRSQPLATIGLVLLSALFTNTLITLSISPSDIVNSYPSRIILLLIGFLSLPVRANWQELYEGSFVLKVLGRS